MSVTDVVTTSSPGSGSTAAMAPWMAVVPDEHATAFGTPWAAATAASSRLTIVPLVLVRVPDSSTSAGSRRWNCPAPS